MLEYLAQGFILIGILLITIEVLVFGFASVILLFVGAAMIVSGCAMLLGFLETSWLWAFSSTSGLTFIFSLAFWKPLKAMQNKVDHKETKTEFSDKTFVLEEDVDVQGDSQYQYSGVMWQLKSQQAIQQGTLVKVDKIEVGVLWVSPVNEE